MNGLLVRPLVAWYDWALFVLLFAGIGMVALIVYDSHARGRRAWGWIAATALPLLALVPSISATLQYPDLDPLILSPSLNPDLGSKLVIYFALGLFGGLLSIAAGALYLFRSSKTAPVVVGRPIGPIPELISRPPSAEPPYKRRPLVNAWLVQSADRRSYQLYKGDTRLGRNPAINDIVLDDQTVSREHILIRQEGETFTLFDRGSRTGTLVNEQRVEGPVLLVHGDAIVLGETELTFTARK